MPKTPPSGLTMYFQTKTRAAAEHTGQRTLPVAALPEQGAEDDSAEGAAETGPRKADDAKNAGIRVAGQHHAHHADADDGQAGCEEALLLAQFEVAELLQNVLGDTLDAAASIWLSAVDIVAARMPARMSPARTAASTPC